MISANGTVDPSSPTDPIVWELQVDQYGSGGVSVLRAYDATNPSVELYDSSMTGNRDLPSGAVKFTVPTVADGHVFVGSQYELSVYGEFPQSTSAPATPTGLAAKTTLGQGSQIQLDWSNPAPAPGAAATGIQIYRSTDGVNFDLLTTVPASSTAVHRSRPVRSGPAVPLRARGHQSGRQLGAHGGGPGSGLHRVAGDDAHERRCVIHQPFLDRRRQRSL